MAARTTFFRTCAYTCHDLPDFLLLQCVYAALFQRDGTWLYCLWYFAATSRALKLVCKSVTH